SQPTPMPVSPIMTDAMVEGSQPFELLRRLELLRSFDDITLEALVEGVEPVQAEVLPASWSPSWPRPALVGGRFVRLGDEADAIAEPHNCCAGSVETQRRQALFGALIASLSIPTLIVRGARVLPDTLGTKVHEEVTR
ncbi:MAG: hypothetical protein ACREXX_08825, partial [Gammaproteobacteria bacterium]